MKIKKLLCAALAAMAAVPTVSAFAATEDPVEFSTVDEMNGQVYVAPFSDMHQGGLKFIGENVNITSVPQGMLSNGATWFCCYDNRFYYLDMDYNLGNIFSCDKNGNNPILIADNASAGEAVFIVDNNLYYTAYSSLWDEGYDYGREYYGGIYKINLATGDWQRLVTDSDAIMYFCDGDYVYYQTLSNNGYYSIDTNGNYCHYANSYDDEFGYNHFSSYYDEWTSYALTGRTTYFIDANSVLYSKPRNGSGLTYIKGLTPGRGNRILKVTKNYIYYVFEWWEDSHAENSHAWLFRIDRY